MADEAEIPAADAQPVAAPEPAPKPAPPKAKADAASPAEDGAFHVTLDEFCAAASAKPGASVELIAAFHRSERGSARDAHANFAERFEAFANRPV